MQISVELLSLLADCATSRAPWSLRNAHSISGRRSRSDFGFLIDSVELVNFIEQLIHCLIQVAELVIWIPRAGELLTLIELVLHGYIAFVLLNEKFRFKFLYLILIFIDLKKEFDIVVQGRSFDNFWLHLSHIVGKQHLNGVLKLLLITSGSNLSI